MNRAINQFPALTELQDGDLLYTVRAATDYSVDASTFAGRVLSVRVTIPTASVLTLFTTPFEIIPAPAAGQVILPLRAVLFLVDGSVDYATNTSLLLATTTGTSVCTFDIQDVLTTPQVNGTGLSPVVKAGEALRASIETGNPTTGDYDIELLVFYQLIDA